MRVLMLGNSLTAANALPQTLALRVSADVVAHTRGGARLAEQLNPATSMGEATLGLLAKGGIDVVVLQEASTHPIRCRSAYLKSVRALTDVSRAAGATPVLFATWPLATGARSLERLGLTREEMADALADAFAEASRSTRAPVADVNAAFMGDADPSSLYARDGVHPSERGSLVAAEVIADAIMGATGRR